MLNKRWTPYFVYGFLTFAILGPLLSPGYILSLDMLFTPKMDFSIQYYGLWEGITARAPLSMLIQLASEIVPVWILQKVLLFVIFFLAGLGAHKLLPHRGAGSYFAGIFYMINPFIYIRFISGQWPFVLAYALTPFAVKAFMDVLDRGGTRNVIKLIVLSTLVGMMLIHALFLLFLIFIVIFTIRMIMKRKSRTEMLRMGGSVGISAAAFLILNIYWVVPVLTANMGALREIDIADLFFFVPKISSMFDLASLHGFWNPGYIYATDFLPFWPVLFIFILFLVIYGLLWRPKEDNANWLAISLAVVGIIGFILAMGVAFDLTKASFKWVFQNLFIFTGFRDTHKFLSLLCLSYAYLGGLGIAAIFAMMRQRKKKVTNIAVRVFIILVLLLPLLYSFPIFGTWGQLEATDYPGEWYDVNAYLSQDEDDYNVLFLPWHLYMDYNWLPNMNKRLGNPAWQFFDKSTIMGDNIEINGKYSGSTNPISKYVEFLLSNANSMSNLGELLAPLNVKYVLLVHEADYTNYDFLYQQEDLLVDLEKPGLTLFKNEHPTTRTYGVDSVVYINSLEEYLELSKNQDVMEHLYIIGSGPSDNGKIPMEKLTSVKKSPVGYLIGGIPRKYTIFTVPQLVNTQHWEYNGEEPLFQNLGFMPAFASSPDGGKIIYTRFYYIYLPSYVISVIALGLVVYLYFRRSKHKRL